MVAVSPCRQTSDDCGGAGIADSPVDAAGAPAAEALDARGAVRV